MKNSLLQRFFSNVIQQRVYSNQKNLKQFLNFFFGESRFIGKKLLDIGGGSGFLSIYAACRGGESICLEPGAEGSKLLNEKKFLDLKNSIDPSLKATFWNQSFQDFAALSDHYDIIFLANSINHLDETACENIHQDSFAWQKYKQIFLKIFYSLKTGGKLILTDCDRSNFFNDFGFDRSPICPTIEWKKHQSPFLWRRMLKEVGFCDITINWSAPNCLGRFGRFFLGNRLTAYFLLSHFKLVAYKSGRNWDNT